MCSVAVNFSKLASWVLVRRKARSRASVVEHETPRTVGELSHMCGGDQGVAPSGMSRSVSYRAFGGGRLEFSRKSRKPSVVSSSLRFATTAEGSEGRSSGSFCHVFLA